MARGRTTRTRHLGSGARAWVSHRRRSAAGSRPGAGTSCTRGVPVLGRHQRRYEQALLAACLAVGPVVAASHRSAAVLAWTAELSRNVRSRSRDPGDVARAAVRSSSIVSLISSRRGSTRSNGVPCTTPARTLVDLGAVCRPFTVGAALDRAIGRQLVTRRRGPHGHAGGREERSRRRRRHASPCSRADRRCTGRSARSSHGVAPAAACVPVPVAEYTVHDGLGHVRSRRVDFAYPDVKLRDRGRRLRAAHRLESSDMTASARTSSSTLKWSVHRFTWTEVDQQSPRVARIGRRASASAPLGLLTAKNRTSRRLSVPRTTSVPRTELAEGEDLVEAFVETAQEGRRSRGRLTASMLTPMQQVPQCESSVTLAAAPDERARTRTSRRPRRRTVERERRARDVARHEVGALEHRPEQRGRDSSRQLVQHAGERLGEARPPARPGSRRDQLARSRGLARPGPRSPTRHEEPGRA